MRKVKFPGKALAPCPFCGAGEIFVLTGDRPPAVFYEGGRLFVGCVKCGARGPMVKETDCADDNQVVNLWNRRVNESTDL